MAQQINLLHPDLLSPTGWLVASRLPWAVGATLLLAALAGGALRYASQQAAEQALQIESTLRVQAPQLASAGTAGPLAELQQLRTQEADQRRVREALEANAAATAPGYAAYLLALSRQTQPSVWVTGFSIGPDNNSMELTGRMTEPALLTAYLKKLNAEDRFRGQQFGRFSLRAVEPAGAPDHSATWTEFTLRSQTADADKPATEVKK